MGYHKVNARNMESIQEALEKGYINNRQATQLLKKLNNGKRRKIARKVKK